MTMNDAHQIVNNYRLTCEINTLNAILQKGELDAKHTKIVQQVVVVLTAQLNTAVRICPFE